MNVKIRKMIIEDYEGMYHLWMNTPGMGLKAALVAFSNNELGNTFWEGNGFHVRTDLTYRNRSIRDIIRIDT